MLKRENPRINMGSWPLFPIGILYPVFPQMSSVYSHSGYVLYKNGGHKVVFHGEPTTSFFHTVVVSTLTGVTVLFKVLLCVSTQLCLLFKEGGGDL